MVAALPASFKLASESKIIIHPEFDGDLEGLSEFEIKLLNLLSHQSELTVSKISKMIMSKNYFSIINNLIRQEIIQVREDLYEKYNSKKISLVKFLGYDNVLNCPKLTVKQRSFIDSYIALNSTYQNKDWTVTDLLKNIGFSRAIFNNLVSKKIFAVEKKQVSRLLSFDDDVVERSSLVEFQKEALKQVNICFQEKSTCLLHGVTSSGKTELILILFMMN